MFVSGWFAKMLTVATVVYSVVGIFGFPQSAQGHTTRETLTSTQCFLNN